MTRRPPRGLRPVWTLRPDGRYFQGRVLSGVDRLEAYCEHRHRDPRTALLCAARTIPKMVEP